MASTFSMMLLVYQGNWALISMIEEYVHLCWAKLLSICHFIIFYHLLNV